MTSMRSLSPDEHRGSPAGSGGTRWRGVAASDLWAPRGSPGVHVSRWLIGSPANRRVRPQGIETAGGSLRILFPGTSGGTLRTALIAMAAAVLELLAKKQQ